MLYVTLTIVIKIDMISVCKCFDCNQMKDLIPITTCENTVSEMKTLCM